MGASTAEKLEKARIRTIGNLAHTPLECVQKIVGMKLGKQLFAELWDGHTPLRLIGVSLTEMTKEEPAQFSLFPDEKKERSRKLDVGKKYKAQMEVNDDPKSKD